MEGLRRTLDKLASLSELGRSRYHTDELVRLCVQRLWITAGNYAEAYRVAADIPTGVEPWSELYGYRSILAHMLPEEISDNRVWYETVEGIDRIRSQISRP